MLKYIVPAAVLAFFMAFTSAWAMPAGSSQTMVGAPVPQIIQVQARPDLMRRPGTGHRGPGSGRHRHRYTPGVRLRRPPRGWHRFHRRPSYWRTRGCVIVGSVWWCP